MEITEVDKQKMEALRALADISLKISAAQQELSQVKGGEAAYIKEREAVVLKKIDDLLTESQSILKQTYQNYEEVKQFAQAVTEFADKITEFHKVLTETNQLLDQKSKEVETLVDSETKKLGEIKKEIKIDRIHIANEREGLVKREKEIVKQETKVRDRMEEVSRTITRLKQGKI